MRVSALGPVCATLKAMPYPGRLIGKWAREMSVVSAMTGSRAVYDVSSGESRYDSVSVGSSLAASARYQERYAVRRFLSWEPPVKYAVSKLGTTFVPLPSALLVESGTQMPDSAAIRESERRAAYSSDGNGLVQKKSKPKFEKRVQVYEFRSIIPASTFVPAFMIA